VLTVVIEVPLVVLLTREIPRPAAHRALLAVFAQFVTHPLVWFVFPRIAGITGTTALTLSEIWAWLGESLFYAVALPPLRPLRAVGIAGVANALSLGVGLLLR
jgi:hypothetical protein